MKLPCRRPPLPWPPKVRRRPTRRCPEPRFLKIAFAAHQLLFHFGFLSWRGPSTFAEKQFLENRRVPIDLPLRNSERGVSPLGRIVTPRAALNPGAPHSA